MPTWLTVGPADFWGGTNNVGVFSTGVNARVPIEWVPQQYGEWSVTAGVQLINSQLRNAQGESSAWSAPGDRGHRNVFGFTRLGISLLTGGQQAGLAGYRGYHGVH
jgi:hypothetical protein